MRSFADCIDLEAGPDKAVVYTKKIEIPGHPYAFNPSIVRWNKGILMSFREVLGDCSTEFPCCARSRIGLVWLDKKFNPKSEVFSFEFNSPNSHVQDPRLIVIGQDLYMVYSDYVGEAPSMGSMRMWIAKLEYDGTGFTMIDPQPWTSFYGESPMQAEKNWVPFTYKRRLQFAYSLSPHIILKPVWGTQTCNLVSNTQSAWNWQWGEPRGGTPAVELEGWYLGFFHSSMEMASIQSGCTPARHYFMGAYLFSKNPPFQVTHISRKPITAAGFYSGASYEHYWKPVCVIFPCGIIVDENDVWVSYGRQDHECWVMKIDRKKLFRSLVCTELAP